MTTTAFQGAKQTPCGCKTTISRPVTLRRPNSATFTFIKRHGQVFAVTCGHVVDEVSNEKSIPGARLPTLALHVEPGVLNLSQITGIGRINHVTRVAEKVGVHRDVDIAIARLPDNYWAMLVARKRKIAIDLDAWREPDWKSVKMCAATGYPNEHKNQVDVEDRDMVAASFLKVVAEVSSELGSDKKFITLSSTLDEPHGHYFSGMSGGPIYAIEGDLDREVSDEELIPIAIIFEGYPGSGRGEAAENVDLAAAFLTDRDIFFRGLLLTPETFDEWLKLVR